MSELLEPHTIDLHSAHLDWVEMAIPDSDRPVQLSRLYVDHATLASLSLVAFPRGWRRPDTGSYTVAEEFLVLRGSIEVSGVRHGVGDYTLLPAYTPRTDSQTPVGCLALAAFSGPPNWQAGKPNDRHIEGVVHTAADQALRAPGHAFQGELKVQSHSPRVSNAVMDLFELRTGMWHLVPPGSTPPSVTTPTVIRWW